MAEATRTLNVIIYEEVVYKKTIEIPVDTPDADIETLLEQDWAENGDPIAHFYEVTEREVQWSPQ